MTSGRRPPADLPPPPPPEDWIRFLRWMLTFGWAGLRQGFPTDRSTGGSESGVTLAIAISTDVAMVLAKAVAAGLTGSAALFAETLHSLADTGNQLLLLHGVRRARQPPDLRHPFGYGAEVFYWSLLAALGMFAVGGVLAIWEGIQHLLHPSAVDAVTLGAAVLGLGLVLDAVSLSASFRQLRREARERSVRFRQHLQTTTDTAVATAFQEDRAALAGDLLALAGLGLHQVLHSSLPDAAAGIAVGLLLTGIGLRLASRNRDLLTNRSQSPVVLDRVRAVLADHPEVEAVGQVSSIYVGPHRLVVTAEVQPVDGMTGRRLCEVLEELRDSVLKKVPRTIAVFVTPILAVAETPELTPRDRDYWLRRFPDQEQV